MIENKEQKKYLEDIMTQIENGKVLSEIVSRYNSKIKRLLFEECGERGRKALILDFERTQPILEIIELYTNNNLSIEDIAKKLRISEGRVIDVIQKYEYLTGRKIEHSDNVQQDVDEKSIIEDYRSGKQMINITKENNTTYVIVRKIIARYLSENGPGIEEERKRILELERKKKIEDEIAKKREGKKVEKRKRYKKKKIALDVEEIYFKHTKNKMTLQQLADEYHVSAGTISNRIREYIIEHNIDMVEESDQQNSDEIKDKKLKITTRYSIENILQKYKYSYEQLSQIALEAGYIVPKDIYESVVEELNKQRKGESR